MRCCVPFCRNSSDNVSTSEQKSDLITFHGFPSEVHLRAAWLRALGNQDAHLPDSAVVCSQHFLNNDVYETDSGWRQVGAGAVPSTLLVCIMCLDMDSKVFLMSKLKLEEAYQMLVGHPLCDQGSLRQTVCIRCAQRLRNFSRFRGKSLKAHAVLMDLVEKHELITLQHRDMINYEKNQLECNLGSTTLRPNHCDLHIVEQCDDNKQTELEEHRFNETVIVKTEQSDNWCYEVKIEHDDHEDNVKDEFIVPTEEYILSDNAIKLETQLIDDAACEALQRKSTASSTAVAQEMPGTLDLIKHEKFFICTLCCEEFPREHEYNEHLNTHPLRFDSADEYDTSRMSEPQAAASSSCKSHMAKYRQALYKLDDPRPSADLTHTVLPVSARLATNYENKVHPTDGVADTSQKSVRVLKTNNNGSGNSETNPNNSVVKLCNVLKNPKISIPMTKTRQTKSYSQDIDTASNDFSDQAASQTKGAKRQCTQSSLKTLQSETNCNVNKQFNNLSRTSEQTYSCELCEYRSARKSHLVRHVKTHTGEKPFSCELCEYRSARRSNLVTHMRTHTGIKPYSCELCEHKFAHKTLLVTHMRIHTGENPYSCTLCEYRFAQKSRLIRHMKIHTGEKPYSCELCEYRCVQKSSLVRHMTTHTSEKPYSCQLCGFKCALKAYLLRHIRTHTGEKPYSCEVCDYKCGIKNLLVTHMRTHTGEKPYSCTFCEYRSAQKKNLVRHMGIHTG